MYTFVCTCGHTIQTRERSDGKTRMRYHYQKEHPDKVDEVLKRATGKVDRAWAAGQLAVASEQAPLPSSEGAGKAQSK